MIGFDNKTKREAMAAQATQEVVPSNSAEAVQNVSALKLETITRFEQIASFICSNNFAQMGFEDKANVVRDFSYFSQMLATMP